MLGVLTIASADHGLCIAKNEQPSNWTRDFLLQFLCQKSYC